MEHSEVVTSAPRRGIRGGIIRAALPRLRGLFISAAGAVLERAGLHGGRITAAARCTVVGCVRRAPRLLLVLLAWLIRFAESVGRTDGKSPLP
jgi:hypothetical protein